MSGTDNLINGGSALGIGGYLCAVVWQGNVQELGTLLKNETGYIDFVVALFVLGAIQKWGPASKISSALTAITLIGLAIKVGNNTNFNSAITKFGQGQLSIMELIKELMK